MSKEKKAQVIDQLQGLFAKSKVGIMTDYQGLTVAEMTNLRRRLRESGIEYKVVKNTLARLAAERAGKKELSSLFEGTVAIAFGFDKVAESTKALTEYIRNTKSNLTIKGGFLDSRPITPQEVSALATLPPREVLIAQVLAGMQSPIVNLLSVLAAPLREVLGVLQARIKQLEG